MIVKFTKSGAVALWQMVCQPGAHLEQKYWYRAEDSTGEVEMARLNKFCEEVLPIKTGTDEVLDRSVGKVREVASREFDECVHSLRQDIVDRAKEVVKHYRKQAKDGRGKILPGVFAELDASLKGVAQPTDEPLEDAADAEELEKLRVELQQRQAVEQTDAPPLSATPAPIAEKGR